MISIVKRKISTFIKKPHKAIQKYFRIIILKEILPLYNENYNECWGHISYKNKVVLDLGADYGSTAYYFLKHGAKNVIAVEGDRDLALKLFRNYDKDPRVICIEKWISDHKDIENLISFKPDVVKVDIEGSEIHINQASPKILSSVKEWLIEIHTKEVYEQLSKLFKNMKYKVFDIDYNIVGVYKIIYARAMSP